MSDKDTKNPFEEIQKQLQELLKTNNPNVTVNPFVPPQQAPPTSSTPEEPKESDEVLKQIQAFKRKPKEIRDYLDRFVIRQDEAKKVLSVAICDHYNHVRQCIEDPSLTKKEYNKQNILLLGPTGVGKTYLMRNIAKLIGVPFVKADATKFSETGYVGSDVEDLVRDLYKLSDQNAELAQYGIIYIDEIDKIAGSSEMGGKDVSGRGVQINLLKLMEDADVNLVNPQDMMSQMQAMMSMGQGGKKQKRTLSTKNILFIVSGAFDKLAENVRKRLDQGQIGFSSQRNGEEADDSHFLKLTETRDFMDYGFEPEFIGRLPVRVACEALSKEDLAQILKNSEGSILDQYHRDFKGYDIDFSITDEAILAIADRASKEKTGARGLMTVLEKTFREFKFELSSTLIQNFEVTSDTVENPQEALKDILLNNQAALNDFLFKRVAEFISDFKEKHGLDLEFSEDACAKIVELAVNEDRSTSSICEQLFKDYEHGLKIVSRNSGKTRFLITADAVDNPDGELSKWVVESIKGKDAVAEEKPEAEPEEEKA
ncbi:AAA family ATPase [Opitutia bacterium ISCC 51]|nr:AAA family ATPase [Opitutae bacterium ISCC 51]QXD26871.1 AAA family ATPase [Opitutae bacterium ISCC 52]